VRSALEWASRHWSVDQNPGMGQKGLFYYFNIMAKALSLHGADTLSGPDESTIPWKKELIEKLAATQRPDGSWLNKDNQFWEGDAVLVTSYAILTLEYALGK
jgi:squalene-hopene/tetraprenyl-beta-curcumene cyclase